MVQLNCKADGVPGEKRTGWDWDSIYRRPEGVGCYVVTSNSKFKVL